VRLSRASITRCKTFPSATPSGIVHDLQIRIISIGICMAIPQRKPSTHRIASFPTSCILCRTMATTLDALVPSAAEVPAYFRNLRQTARQNVRRPWLLRESHPTRLRIASDSCQSRHYLALRYNPKAGQRRSPQAWTLPTSTLRVHRTCTGISSTSFVDTRI
jgi:hypothetical protein